MGDDTSAPSTVASLLRAVGGWTNPSGRGLFMFSMMTTNMSAAALSGVAGAYLAGTAFGPVAALGFAVGSSVGWVLSTVYYWRSTSAIALKAFDTHPQLMMLHLIRNYRTFDFEKVPMRTEEDVREFRGRLRGELKLRCLLMAAWHSARPSIDEITDRREALLVDKLSNELESPQQGYLIPRAIEASESVSST